MRRGPAFPDALCVCNKLLDKMHAGGGPRSEQFWYVDVQEGEEYEESMNEIRFKCKKIGGLVLTLGLKI